MGVRRHFTDSGDVRDFCFEYFNESGRLSYVRVTVCTMVCRTLRAAASHANASPLCVLPHCPALVLDRSPVGARVDHSVSLFPY